MKIKIIFIVGVISLLSCNNEINNKIRPKTTEIKTNERLIGYKAIEKGESENDISKNKFNKVNVRYVDELIIIKTYKKVNDCAKYIMDINIQNDTIVLKYDLANNNLCKCQHIDELTYIIDNPTKKKYVIIKSRD